MLSEKAKKAFFDLNLPYSAVALKFCRNKPEGYQQAEEKDKFCTFVKKAQDGNKPFYTTIENDVCMGKFALGMAEPDSASASGMIGHEVEIFKTPAANARLFYEAPMLKRGVCNFVVFCPLEQCGFDPDLIICIADADQTQVILRATSYISGDLWEAKCTYVMSCAWAYVNPYITGKVNHLLAGMYFGQQQRNTYPVGLHIISIPFQKIDEVVSALTEMRHVPAELGKDEKSLAETQVIHDHIAKISSDINIPNRL